MVYRVIGWIKSGASLRVAGGGAMGTVRTMGRGARTVYAVARPGEERTTGARADQTTKEASRPPSSLRPSFDSPSPTRLSTPSSSRTHLQSAARLSSRSRLHSSVFSPASFRVVEAAPRARAFSSSTASRASNLHSRESAPPPLNEVDVPLISPHLRSQLFPPPNSPYAPAPPTAEAITISRDHLRSHDLLSPPSSSPPPPAAPAVDFTLPALQGPTITHHFHALAEHSSHPYLPLATSFVGATTPPQPTKNRWVLQRGWTRYTPDGASESVEYPAVEDQVLVFDVETLPYQGGDYPVMAVAVGESAWYAWCSPWLTGEDESPNHLVPLGPEAKSDEGSTLFESEEETPRLVVGHNVLFDRARVGTEYALRRPATRWLDTLSLHVAVSGLTNPQRPSWIAYRRDLAEAEAEQDARLNETAAVRRVRKKEEAKKEALKPKTWKEVSSLNSLVEVARLHCGTKMDKSLRDTFIDPLTTIVDVREEFESLVAYCATDVLVTLQVFRVLLPKFLATCPHPASFGGILLMSQPVLPVDRRWPQYIERAEKTYEERLTGVKDALKIIVEDARAKFGKVGKDGRYEWEDDRWLSQLDWSPKRARRLPGTVPVKLRRKSTTDKEKSDKDRFPPVWYSALGKKTIPLTSPLAYLLLRTTYKTYPVVFTHSHGWLFAVPSRRKSFVPAEKENLVESSTLGPKDDLARTLPGVKLYSIPGQGAGRCRTIGGPAWKKRIEEDVLESPYKQMKSAATELSPKATLALVRKVAALAKESIGMPSEERKKDLWLRQLDWTPDLEARPLPKSRTKVERVEEEVESAGEEEAVVVVDRNELVWPKWYWDLDAPGLGLDVSIGKRAVPLLLRLQWKGFPIVHSKEHGWIYRVPSAQVDDVLVADTSLKPLNFADVNDSNLGEDKDAAFFRLPHPDGEDKNVGSPLSKPFVAAFEEKVLTSEYPAAAAALAMNASCSYWTSSRERIVNQMVVWERDAKAPAPTPSAIAASPALESTQGLILPQVIPMGTVTRRAVEKTWLTASNAKKNRVGSELKSMIRAPPGYAIVGADVDSEELWICSVMGDAQFGIHGATAIGWMTLEGTKAAGTDLHSKSASILGISRDDAKVFNYSRIYGAGVKHAVQLLLKSNPSLSTDHATKLAKALYAGTKGVTHRGGAFDRQFWHGGTESFVFNKLEQIAQSDKPRTPALGCGLTDALTKSFLPAKGRSKAGEDFMPSRINWVVQSSGVDYLHLLLVAMEYLTKRFGIDARYMISVHDEIRYLVKEEDKYRLAMALQISNLWTRSLFSYRLQMGDLPQGCAFFSAVDIDHCFRKEVNMTCLTPSNPDAIPFGESLDISDSLAKTHHGSLYADGRSMEEPQVPISTLPYELSDAEVRGEEHRVGTTPFLIAQTTKSTSDIFKLWNEAGGRPARRSWSNERSSDEGSPKPSSRNYQKYDELSYIGPEPELPKRTRAAPKRLGRAEPAKAKVATVAKEAKAKLESLQMYKDLAEEEDWDAEEVPEEWEEEAFRQPASFRAQV